MRNRFDQFGKLMVREGFAPGGAVETDAEVSPDARRIDVWFTPNPALAAAGLSHLGLLGRIARTACTLEPFHATPGGDEVMGCVCKNHLFREQLARRVSAPPLPEQWILSSGRPSAGLAGLRFRRSRRWGAGVYEGPPLAHTKVIVVSELPVTRDTLLVRLMGAGQVLRRAVDELKELAPDAPERLLALPILLRLRLEVPADPAQRTPDDEEFFMSTQDIVESLVQQGRKEGRKEGRSEGRKEGRSEGRKEGRSEGRKEGRSEGLAEAVLALYEARFGAPPAEISAAIGGTHDPAILRDWLQITGTRSVEEVAAAVRASTPR